MPLELSPKASFLFPPGDGEGQGSLGCCSPWGPKESDTTEHLNSSNETVLAYKTHSHGSSL